MNTFRNILAAVLVPLALIASAGAADAAVKRRPTGDNVPAYCKPLDSGRKNAPGVDNSITVSAPEGYSIFAYCYQSFTAAGVAFTKTVVSGFVPGNSVTITATRDIGHYSLAWYLPSGG